MSTITTAVEALSQGGAVILLSGFGTSRCGDLVFGAETSTPPLVAFAVRHTSGFLCVAMTDQDCDRLELPLQVAMRSSDDQRPAYTVTVDARDGVTTGISSIDRSHTIRQLARPDCSPEDLTRPGHIVPVRVGSRGVLEQVSAPAAAVDLMRIAGLRPIAAMSTLMSTSSHGNVATPLELRQFSARHDLPIVPIEDVLQWRRGRDRRLAPILSTVERCG